MRNKGIQMPEPIRLCDVLPARVHWVWPNRIPAAITVIEGDPGESKSTLSYRI